MALGCLKRNVFITDLFFFPPTTPKLLFLGLLLLLLFPAPVKVPTSHLIGQGRKLGGILPPCLCPPCLCSLLSTSGGPRARPFLSSCGLISSPLSSFLSDFPFPCWCPGLGYGVLSIHSRRCHTKMFPKSKPDRFLLFYDPLGCPIAPRPQSKPLPVIHTNPHGSAHGCSVGVRTLPLDFPPNSFGTCLISSSMPPAAVPLSFLSCLISTR